MYYYSIIVRLLEFALVQCTQCTVSSLFAKVYPHGFLKLQISSEYEGATQRSQNSANGKKSCKLSINLLLSHCAC